MFFLEILYLRLTCKYLTILPKYISSFQNIVSVTCIICITHLFVPITKFVSLKKTRYDLTRFRFGNLSYFFFLEKSNIPIKLECLTKTDILLNSLTKVDLSSQLNTVK